MVHQCWLSVFQFIGSAFTTVRLEKVKKILLLWWCKNPHCGLVQHFLIQRGKNHFFAFSFMLGECTNLFWKWHGCKKQLCHHQWGSAPFLFPSSFSVWNSMSYNISLLDLLANTDCHCVTSSSAGDKNTDEQLVTDNLERWPEHSQGDSQAVTSVSQTNMSTCSK